ncbi:MAG: hypothetical protein KGD64_02215 [Candidatus Heimdallarchaeota archaeon]|nr:hypothetical protein [Candidatus Heimdallarchaeota archaeon]
MLHNIWIAKDTGECLFHRKYGSIEHDENLITSFLSAIEIFAQNIDNGCDLLQTSSYKFIYISGEQTVTVACVDCKDDENVIRQELRKIEKEFYSRFSNDLKEWSGRVERFADLSDYVDNHLKKYSLPIQELSNTKLELNPIVTKENLKSKFSPQQEKVISLLKYKGTATLHDIIKLMKLSENDAENAAKGLLYNDVIRQIPSA